MQINEEWEILSDHILRIVEEVSQQHLPKEGEPVEVKRMNHQSCQHGNHLHQNNFATIVHCTELLAQEP